MKFALIAGQRIEAFAGGRGACPLCRGEVIAKCGSQRIPHWAHRGIRDCDSWAESETEWHRAWKNRFPTEFQEFIQHDETSGERHIADVRTAHGLVLEFQHSHIDPDERTARERFYGNMVWIVDGTRLQRDYPRFLKGKDGLRPIIQGYYLLAFPEECFPAIWLSSSVPVIFDFRGNVAQDSSDPLKSTLWCLIPGRAEGNAVVVGMSAEQLVEVAPTRPQLLPVAEILSNISKGIREQRAQREHQHFASLRGAAARPRRRFKRF